MAGALALRGRLVHALLAKALAAALGTFLFHAQHTFPGAVRSRGHTATARGYYDNAMRGSTRFLLPDWLAFFTAGIEYHHIHHLNTRVPCYRLRECQEAAPQGIWAGVPEATFGSAWRDLDLVLYDEQQGRLISWAEYDAAAEK